MSRCHATLKLSEDDVYLNDNNSKFGTLVEMREEVELVPDKAFTLQTAGTVVTLLVKEPKLTYEDRLEDNPKLKESMNKYGRENTDVYQLSY